MIRISEVTDTLECMFVVDEHQTKHFDENRRAMKRPTTVLTINTRDAEIKVLINGRIEDVAAQLRDALRVGANNARRERRKLEDQGYVL